MAQKEIAKVIDNIRGINKGVSVLSKPVEHALEMTNCVKHPDGTITWRKGFKTSANRVGGLEDLRGLHTYEYYDTDTGASLQEMIAYSSSGDFLRVIEKDIVITYSGAAGDIILNVFPDISGRTRLVITDDADTTLLEYVFNGDVGQLSLVVSAINGLTDFTCTVSGGVGGGVPPKAFPIVVNESIVSGGTFTYLDFEEIETVDLEIPYLPPQIGSRNATFLNENSICYIATGGYLAKYDGHQIVRVGVPRPRIGVSATTGSAGSLTGRYYYHAEFEYRDATGLTTYSALSPSYRLNIDFAENTVTLNSEEASLLISPPRITERMGQFSATSGNVLAVSSFNSFNPPLEVGDSIVFLVSGVYISRLVVAVSSTTITIDGAAVATSSDFYREPPGFRFAGARTSGTQSSKGGVAAPITVDSGHTILVGDYVYITTENTGRTAPSTDDRTVGRTVTATTSTTITVDGDATLSMEDNTSIYVGFKVNLYRSKANGSKLYKHSEHIPFQVTSEGVDTYKEIFFDDDVGDDELGAEYIAPERDPDPAPKLNWITLWDGQLVGGGGSKNPSTLFFSQQADLASWPVATNAIDLQLGGGDALTAGADVDGLLYVFTLKKRAALAGTLYDGAISIEVFDDGIGCTSHNSIQELPEGVMFLSQRGLEVITSRGFIDAVVNPVRELFREKYYTQIVGQDITTEQESLYNFARAVSFKDTRNSRVIYYIPAELTDGSSDVYPNSNGLTLVFDYLNQNLDWYVWELANDLNFYGGMCLYKDNFYAASVGASSSADGHLLVEINRNDKYSLSDNSFSITQTLTIGWDDAGEPSVPKYYNDINVWQIKESAKVPHTLTVNTYRNFNDIDTHSKFPMDFTDVTYIKQHNKLRSGKADAIAIEMTNSTLNEGFSINGIELDSRFAYNDEMTKRNG